MKEGDSIGLIDQNHFGYFVRTSSKSLLHELGHCAIFSFNLLDDIHRMVLPKYWFEAEEWVCNFIADYRESIFGVAYSILGEDAWALIPYELEKLIA